MYFIIITSHKQSNQSRYKFKTSHSAIKSGLKLNVVLKRKDVYVESLRAMLIMDCLKIDGNLMGK